MSKSNIGAYRDFPADEIRVYYEQDGVEMNIYITSKQAKNLRRELKNCIEQVQNDE